MLDIIEQFFLFSFLTRLFTKQDVRIPSVWIKSYFMCQLKFIDDKGLFQGSTLSFLLVKGQDCTTTQDWSQMY